MARPNAQWRNSAGGCSVEKKNGRGRRRRRRRKIQRRIKRARLLASFTGAKSLANGAHVAAELKRWNCTRRKWSQHVRECLDEKCPIEKFSPWTLPTDLCCLKNDPPRNGPHLFPRWLNGSSKATNSSAKQPGEICWKMPRTPSRTPRVSKLISRDARKQKYPRLFNEEEWRQSENRVKPRTAKKQNKRKQKKTG